VHCYQGKVFKAIADGILLLMSFVDKRSLKYLSLLKDFMMLLATGASERRSKRKRHQKGISGICLLQHPLTINH